MATKGKKTNIKSATISNDNELLKLIKLVVIITLIFLVFYAITIFINKKDPVEESKTPATIQYDEILIGNILKQPNKSYYVLVQEIEDYNLIAYQAYITNYKSKKDSIRVYTAILNDPLNSKFIGEDVVYDVTDATELRFNKTALVKIENGKITEYYDEEDIKKKFMDLVDLEEEKEESEN